MVYNQAWVVYGWLHTIADTWLIERKLKGETNAKAISVVTINAYICTFRHCKPYSYKQGVCLARCEVKIWALHVYSGNAFRRRQNK